MAGDGESCPDSGLALLPATPAGHYEMTPRAAAFLLSLHLIARLPQDLFSHPVRHPCPLPLGEPGLCLTRLCFP